MTIKNNRPEFSPNELSFRNVLRGQRNHFKCTHTSDVAKESCTNIANVSNSASSKSHGNLSNVVKSAKKLKKIQYIHGCCRRDKGGNACLHTMASELQKMYEPWEEHKCGLNGGPALMELERNRGARWRNNRACGAGRQPWNRRMDMHLEVQQIMHYVTEKEALDSLQLELDSTVKKGRSKNLNIAILI